MAVLFTARNLNANSKYYIDVHQLHMCVDGIIFLYLLRYLLRYVICYVTLFLRDGRCDTIFADNPLLLMVMILGEGVFVYNGSVEDSATAEISRSQIWQWIRHGVQLEQETKEMTPVSGGMITKPMVLLLIGEQKAEFFRNCSDEERRERFDTASQVTNICTCNSLLLLISFALVIVWSCSLCQSLEQSAMYQMYHMLLKLSC